MNNGDIFLNTTGVDNAPVSVVEAMACGLCVVSTNVGGIPYLLEHEYDSLLVPSNDPAAMATAVRKADRTRSGKAPLAQCPAKGRGIRLVCHHTEMANAVGFSGGTRVSDALLNIYHRLPPRLRSVAASLRGLYLHSWRYGPDFERLVEAALEREHWNSREWKTWQEERSAFVLNRSYASTILS